MKKIRLSENAFHQLIKESVNRILKEWESGYYPMGAENDPRAPYNQPDEPDWDEMYGDKIDKQIENEIDSQDDNFIDFCVGKYNVLDEVEDFSSYAHDENVRKAYHDYRYDLIMDDMISDYSWDDMDDFYYDEDETRYSRDRY